MYQGEDPWFALGCFLHDWWCDARDHRQDLIAEPPAPVATPEGRRWAAFCAAVVEELCSKTGFPCPAWTKRQDYVLEHPWSVLDNKYELHQMFGSKPSWTPWSEQELQHLLASNESAEVEIVP